MSQGWWADVRAEETDAAGRHRAARWLVGIDDEERARRRLAEELREQDRIVPLHKASVGEQEHYGVGRSHLRQV